jgi:glycosyltransferase 2 family protein
MLPSPGLEMSHDGARRRRWLPFVLKAVVSLALLVVLFRQTDVSAVLGRARHADPRWLAAALALYGVMILLSAWRWQVLLHTQRIRAPFGLLANSWLVATFFNNFLPSNIGGDVVRIADSARLTGSRTVAGAVVVVDRAMGLVALLCVAAAGSLMSPAGGLRLAGTEYLWIGALVALGVAVPAVMAPRLLPRLLSPLCRLRPGLFEPRLERLGDTLARFKDRRLQLGQAFAGAFLVQLVLVGFFLCVASAIGAALPAFYGLIVVPVSLVVQMLPISINGFGVREAVFSYFFVQLGLGVEAGLALSLISAGLIMLFSLSGGVVFLGRRALTPAPASSDNYS